MKHRSLPLKLFALVAAMMCALGASAYDFVSNDIYYNITGTNTVEVTNGVYYSGAVTIPSTVTNGGKTYTVTRVGKNAFRDCVNLTSVGLPTTIEVIDTMAFFYTKKLKSIIIPEGVKRIAFRNFYCIDSLTTAVLPSTLQFFDNECFYYCPKLSSVTCMATTPPAADNYCFFLLANDCALYVPEGSVIAYAIAEGWKNIGHINPDGNEAYACYTPSNTTLTFYYDDQRDSRPGTTYDINKGWNSPAWCTDGTNANVTRVVFDPSFALALPTTAKMWFAYMTNLQSIEGLSYLNTIGVTNMNNMFTYSSCLTSLDLSHFDTSHVTDISSMFYYCTNLKTIYVGDGWSTAAVTSSADMFYHCTKLVGGQGTTYNANHITGDYAHIDGGPSNPGYFTAAAAMFLRGDVNGNGNVNTGDLSALISLLLGGGDLPDSADCNQDGNKNIGDVPALINYLLTGSW